MSSQEPVRRQSPSERYHELSMAWATRPLAAPEHSLDITRNAKGDWQYSLTVRGADLADVLEAAFEAVEQLEAKYPRAGSLVSDKARPVPNAARAAEA